MGTDFALCEYESAPGAGEGGYNTLRYGATHTGPTDTSEVIELLDKVRRWLAEVRRSVAREILASLTTPGEAAREDLANGKCGRPVRELIGIGVGRDSPASDERVRQWVAEWRNSRDAQ